MIRKLRKHFLKLFITTVLLVTALIFFGLKSDFVADTTHHYLLAYLEDRLQSKIEMGRPEIAWLRGIWYIKDVSIRPHLGKEKREFLKAKRVRIHFSPWWNIFKRDIRISSVEVDEPVIYFRIEKGDVANLPKLDFMTGPQGIIRFSLREIRVSKGRMDLSYPETPMEMAYSNIDMKVRPDFDKERYGFILLSSSAVIKVSDFTQRINSLKGEFNLTPERLNIESAAFTAPEGEVSTKGFSLEFKTAKWETKITSTLDLAALKKAVKEHAGVSKAISDQMEKSALKGKAVLSASIKADGNGFDLKGEAEADEIELDRLRIKATSSIFSSKGKWDSIRESPFDIGLRSRLPVELANRYIERIPGAKGVADLRVTCSVASGPWSTTGQKVGIEGELASSRIEVAEIPVAGFSTRFKGDLEKVNIINIAADLLGGSLRGSGSVGLKDEKGFDGNVRVDNIDLKEVADRLPELVGAHLGVAGRVSGDIAMTGRIRPQFAIDGSSSLKVDGLGVIYGEAFSTRFLRSNIDAQLSYSGGETRIGVLKMSTASSTVSASGDIVDGNLSLALDVKSSDLNELGGYLKGAGALKCKVSGPVKGPRIEGSLELNKVSWGRYHADTVSGLVRFKDRVLSSPGLKVGRGDSEALLKGEVSLAEDMPLDVQVELKKGRLEDVASLTGIDARVKGEMSARARVRGGLKSLDGEIDIRGDKVVVMDEHIGAVNVEGRLEKGMLLLEKGEVLRDGEKVAVSGEIGPEGDTNLRIASSTLSIRDLPYIKKAGVPIGGTLELVGDISGNIRNPSFKGSISLTDVRYKEIGLGKGEVALSLSNKRLTASGAAFGSEIAGDMVLQGDKPFHVTLKTTNLPLNQYFKGMERLEGMTGSLTGTLYADGDISNLKETSVRGSISKLQLVRDPFFLKNTDDIEIELRGGRVIFKSFQLSGRGTDLVTSGWIGMDGEANLLVSGNLDLYLLQLFTKVVEKGSGVVEVRCAVVGKPPKIQGRIALKDGLLEFKGVDSAFTDILGALTLDGESIIVENLTGKIGGGRFKGEGSIGMAGLGIKKTDISFDLRGIHLSFPKWLPSEIEGNIRLTGDYPSLLLSGDINVVRATYSERVDWRTFLPSFKQRIKEPVAVKEGERAVKLDINFKAERNLIFENNVGRGELKGEFRLKGDTSRFGLSGEVEVISGKVFYKEHQFKVTSGVIEFPDPKRIEAVFDFVAEGKVRDYTVQILVRGNINDIKVAMSSSPALSELDIASLLSFGLTTKELQERGGGAPAYGAASLLTREVEDKFKDYIGFDRFYIDPYYSKLTGTTEPKLTVGKGISDEVSVLYSRSLSTGAEQEVQMEYKLYRNFSVLGGWSSFGESSAGDLGADMKFRFEFR